MSVTYRKRFGLVHDPLPRDAMGETFYDGDERYERLRRCFSYLAAVPGLGTLTGDAGSGKTAAMRNLCNELPEPEYRVLYICDTAVTPTAVYRNLAAALGLKPKRSRDALWRQLKGTIEHLVDDEGVIPILIIDEAQHLPDSFFFDLASFLNRNFDSRELLTVWLVGLPSLAARLDMRQHAALRTRLVSPNVMGPRGREELLTMVEHGLKTAGAKTKLLSDPALELLWRISHGLPRTASKLLRAALLLAHEHGQAFVDEHIMLDACDTLQLRRPSTGAASTKSTRGRRTS